MCDKKIGMKMKGKVYKTAVRPAMLYGSETWAVRKAEERKMNSAEMRMLRWSCGVTRLDHVRNEHIRGTIKVTEISKKMQERRLRWLGHVMRREADYVGRQVLDMQVAGERRRGRPKLRWMDRLREDMREKGLTENDTQNRTRWRARTKAGDPI